MPKATSTANRLTTPVLSSNGGNTSGSSLDCIDSSADGRTVYASSCAGYVVRLQRCAIEADEHSSCCYSPFKETRRWIFWDNEPHVIVW
jgi:hypothetical protein